MKIILPMAGRGFRFAEKGFITPKPFINVMGKPMFSWALETIRTLSYSQIVVIALKEHKELFNAEEVIRKHCPEGTEIVFLDEVTDGQLCTVLAAKEYINSEEDILIISSDTIVRSDLHLQLMENNYSEGIISVASMPGDRWSFARTDNNGNVIEVAEKIRISDHASTGLYYFRNGNKFLQLAEEMICNEEKTKGEYYVIPVYQKLIKQGAKVTVSKATEMWDLGTPASLEEFLTYKNIEERAA